MSKLSVVLATFNEEKNIRDCLNSVKDIAQEIIIVDGGSEDNTVKIAKEFGAKILVTTNPPIFHINKQKALNQASNEWILQLDADERVTSALAKEIVKVISFSNNEIEKYQDTLEKKELFLRHSKLLEKRNGKLEKHSDEYVAFFIPRLNYFLGKYLRYGGVYPDGVIRLVKRNKAYFPCINVHEQIAVVGKIGWLHNDLIHMADPTFSRYLLRWQRYTSLQAREIKNSKELAVTKFIRNIFLEPISWFFLTFFRHKGILDLWPGFVFSLFSSLRFPAAYIKSLFLQRMQ
ncbi:glycosyltransferase family 2 protein [soil metagenome]